ncbi:MAG: acetylornithine transaminase [Actinomycetota bacterium]|nr:acetylornithine transaminase [Actinomycetota bacterium]
MSVVVETTADHMMPTYRRWPVEFVSGRGCWVTDASGRSYLDFTAGIAVASVGHAHPRVAAAVAEQASLLVHISNLYATTPQKELASRLAEISGGFDSFFCNSGAEAIECALKLARKWATTRQSPEASRVVAAEGGFHGRTFGALSATGQPTKRAPFEPCVPGFVHVPFGDGDALEAAVGDDVAAVLLEPIQGEAGVVVPPGDYLAAARRVCDESGALLVLDEVQTGVGRTGAFFAHEHAGIVPDVVCLAKGLGGGFPIGVCLARPEVGQTLVMGDHGSTFGGGPVPCAAALAVLEIIASDDLVDRAARAGQRLSDGLRRLVGSRADVRGRGLLIGLGFSQDLAREIASHALDRGLLVNDATPRVVRITPPLTVSDDEIDHGLKVLEEVLNETRSP